jgi:DNA-binding transcriptional regulator of glucitol operon
VDEVPTVRRVLTPRWILVHLAAVVLVIAFLLLGWWQLQRAASGNLLSYGYAIQWPAFAVFVVFVWIKEIRRVVSGGPVDRDRSTTPATRDGAAVTRPARPRRPEAGWDDSDDEDLAAYNHYLAWLNANPHVSPSKYPGRS